ncbi:ATP-binding protein [Mycobacterium gordonae]|nr:ATP-binding protein [Mycobacterium gordonae]
MQKLFADLCVPRRYQSKTLAGYRAELAIGKGYEMAKRYVDKYAVLKQTGQNGLALVGPPGTGKTHLAYGILNALLPQLRSAICGSVPDLMDLLRPKGDDKDLGKQRLQALKTSELVILDDLGAEIDSEWVTERLFMIINTRYNEQLPTIITSNLPLEDLERKPGWERIGSRISEMCFAAVVDGEDYRKRKDERHGNDKKSR